MAAGRTARALMVLVLAGAAGALAADDDAPTAALAGEIHAPKGGGTAPLQGVTVVVRAATGEFNLSTDANGRFEVTLLPPGPADVAWCKAGFEAGRTPQPLKLNPGKTLKVKLVLTALAAGAPEEKCPSLAPPAPGG